MAGFHNFGAGLNFLIYGWTPPGEYPRMGLNNLLRCIGLLKNKAAVST